MRQKPVRSGDSIIFRDPAGVAHPGIFIGKNPAFARVKMAGTQTEIVVPVNNLLLEKAA